MSIKISGPLVGAPPSKQGLLNRKRGCPAQRACSTEWTDNCTRIGMTRALHPIYQDFEWLSPCRSYAHTVRSGHRFARTRTRRDPRQPRGTASASKDAAYIRRTIMVAADARRCGAAGYRHPLRHGCSWAPSPSPFRRDREQRSATCRSTCNGLDDDPEIPAQPWE